MSGTPTSQISLMRVNSNQPKCWVFFEGDDKIDKYELSVDEATTVSGLIRTAINLIKGSTLTIDFTSNDCLFELYASKKSGRKISDLPSLEEKQTILKTGIKFFVLQDNAKKVKAKRISTVSTKSIQSEMKELPIKAPEVKANKTIGCFCF
jgi:hypothetical protein